MDIRVSDETDHTSLRTVRARLMGITMISVLLLGFSVWFLWHMIRSFHKKETLDHGKPDLPPAVARLAPAAAAVDLTSVSLGWTALDEHQLNRLLDGGVGS